MLNWNDLQYVLALKEGKTIKHAAELLGADPTTVSRHIKRISSDFQFTIFRLNKGGDWRLTPKGEELTELAFEFKNRLNQFQLNDETPSENEVVTITSLEFLLTHYLAPHLDKGMACFPDTNISLKGSDRRLSLAYGEADIALRFGRPKEGQLIASKVAEISFELFAPIGEAPREWIGLEEELDWTPEMLFAFDYFGGPPRLRVSCFQAARVAATVTGFATVGPRSVMEFGGHLERIRDTPVAKREVWSVIHATRKFSRRLSAVREWIKQSVAEAPRFENNAPQLGSDVQKKHKLIS